VRPTRPCRTKLTPATRRTRSSRSGRRGSAEAPRRPGRPARGPAPPPRGRPPGGPPPAVSPQTQKARADRSVGRGPGRRGKMRGGHGDWPAEGFRIRERGRTRGRWSRRGPRARRGPEEDPERQGRDPELVHPVQRPGSPAPFREGALGDPGASAGLRSHPGSVRARSRGALVLDPGLGAMRRLVSLMFVPASSSRSRMGFLIPRPVPPVPSTGRGPSSSSSSRA
jgi:hypothetical protein